TTFGAGNPFTFSGPITAGTYDFQGVAAHEISEVLGRLGLCGGTISGATNSHSLIGLFSSSRAGAPVLGNGGGANFSIDNGTTLLKSYNNASSNGLDCRDWAPGTNDAFNQFANSGVTNPVSDVDLQAMDVIGYDRVAALVPEPSTATLLVSALIAVGFFLHRRIKAQPHLLRMFRQLEGSGSGLAECLYLGAGERENQPLPYSDRAGGPGADNGCWRPGRCPGTSRSKFDRALRRLRQKGLVEKNGDRWWVPK